MRPPPARRRRRRIGFLAAGLAVLATAIAPGAAAAGPTRLTIFDAGRELQGELGLATRESTLDELGALGVDVVRFLVPWRQVAPSPEASEPPAGFDPRDPLDYGTLGSNWQKTDAIVQGITSRGMDALLVATGSPPTGRVPRWASRDPNGTQSNPDPGAFEDFMYALGSRYGGGFDPPGLPLGDALPAAAMVSAWNEPSNGYFLRVPKRQGGGRGLAKLYRKLALAAEHGLAESGWDGQLLVGDTGPDPPGKRLDPLPFLRKTLCLDKRYRKRSGCERIDAAGWAHHPYSLKQPPFEPPIAKGQISFGSLKKMTRAIRRARRSGAISADARVYVTEFGYQTLPDTNFGIPLRRQAEFIAIAEYLAHRTKTVASFAQYLMRDDPPMGRSNPGFESGLRFDSSPNVPCDQSGAECKPAYDAFRTPLVARARGRRGKVVLWGRVRPADGVETVRLRVRDRARAPRLMRVIRTDANGYFSLRTKNRRGRRWGLSWSGHKAPLVRAYAF